jgi:anti-sigma factor RsiW
MSYLHRVSRLVTQVRRALQGLIRPPTPHLTCEQVVGFIADYLTGALDPETTAAFGVHLRGCDDCVAFLNTYQRTIAAVQSLRFDDTPAEMEARVRRFLET